MKTVNLLTFHGALNYGAVWQAYALSRTLQRMGCDVSMIDLRLPWDWPSPFSTSGIKQLVHPLTCVKRLMFKHFLKQHFPKFTRIYRTSEDIYQFPPISDVYVVGSDQVWNPKNTRDLIYVYFLDFVSNMGRKVAYAASFGVQNVLWDSEQQRKLSFLLERFDHISVREKSGVNICRVLGRNDAIWVLDPVFLLPVSDYKKLYNKFSPYDSIGPIVTYKFKQDAEFLECLNYLSKELQSPVHFLGPFKISDFVENIITANALNLRTRKRGILYYWFLSPKMWLANLMKSSFVITDSFHGMSFALLFQKNFIVTMANPKQFIRLKELLEELNLSDRIFWSYKEIIDDHRWKKPINYSSVNSILKEKIHLSRDFLQKAIFNGANSR